MSPCPAQWGNIVGASNGATAAWPLASACNWKSIERKDQRACAAGYPVTRQMTPCLSDSVRNAFILQLFDLLSSSSTREPLLMFYTLNDVTPTNS